MLGEVVLDVLEQAASTPDRTTAPPRRTNRRLDGRMKDSLGKSDGLAPTSLRLPDKSFGFDEGLMKTAARSA
jgi:hypothetical protein